MLRMKLIRSKFDSRFIYLVIEKLKDLNLLNDELYSRDYCAYLIKVKHYGKVKILANFKKKGLEPSLYINVIDDEIEKNGGEEKIIIENIKKNALAYNRLYKKGNIDKIKQKLYSHGFSLNTIIITIDKMELILDESI